MIRGTYRASGGGDSYYAKILNIKELYIDMNEKSYFKVHLHAKSKVGGSPTIKISYIKFYQ